MLQDKKNNSRKWWLAIKLCLVVLALYFIYIKVFNYEGSRDYLSQIKSALQMPGAPALFSIVFLLMILNWTIEAVKWKYMIGKIEKISLTRSLEAVFSGLTISFFTPNRIGEYAGRVFHLQEGRRLQATIITIIENSSQLLMTIITGCIACIFYMYDFMKINPMIEMLFSVLLVIFILLCITLYFNLDIIENILLRIKMTEYWRQVLHVFSLYSFTELLKVLFLSLIRYIIFSLQFYLLLKIYGCSFQIAPAIIMISMTFFVMSVVPTFAITEIGIRGAVSAYFFGKLTLDVLPVLNAAFSLWMVNLVIPALAGAVLIFHFRFEKAKE